MSRQHNSKNQSFPELTRWKHMLCEDPCACACPREVFIWQMWFTLKVCLWKVCGSTQHSETYKGNITWSQWQNMHWIKRRWFWQWQLCITNRWYFVKRLCLQKFTCISYGDGGDTVSLKTWHLIWQNCRLRMNLVVFVDFWTDFSPGLLTLIMSWYLQVDI